MRSIRSPVLFIIILLVAAGGGSLVYVVFGANTPAFSGARNIGIPPGSTFEAVVDSLAARGIVRRAASFRIMARATGWNDQVKAGHYAFEAGASNYDLLSALRRGLQAPVRLTVPPGARVETTAAVAARHMFFSPTEFTRALSDSGLAASLETDTRTLYGYMLPETYHFYWLTSAKNAVREIKAQFDAFFERELRARADSLGLSKREVAILASIIEWETADDAEKPMVSGVYHNRLRIGMKLDADPTVQYVVMLREGQKRRLLYEDYRIRHPFNTYLHSGLPPAPLNNPSPSSLMAAVNPARHDFLYFVATGDGTHHFSRTLGEHNRTAQRYHQVMRERRRAARQNETE